MEISLAGALSKRTDFCTFVLKSAFGVPTCYRLKFTNIRRENFWIQIFLDLDLWKFVELSLSSRGKSPFCVMTIPFLRTDFLQIEIYYNKKHLFLDLDFWILNLEFLELSLRFGALSRVGKVHFAS